MKSQSEPSPAERAAGCVLGAAIGDALGHPTEFLSMEAIQQRFGPGGVEDIALYWDRDGAHFAPYTDGHRTAYSWARRFDRQSMHEA